MQINAVIIGAQKCATTSLSHYLAQHPEVCLPKIVSRNGAPHPLESDARNGSTADNWEIVDAASYNGQKIVLQKAPQFMYEPKYASIIAAHNPEMKIIAVLRNQADRAFAHWRHNVRKGREARGFVEALAHEPKRIRRNAYFRRHFSYLDRGHYATQLDRFAEHFREENMLVFSFEQFVGEPQESYNRALTFLGLRHSRLDSTTRFNENIYELRSQALAWPFYALNFIMTEQSVKLHRLRMRLHGRLNLRRSTVRQQINPDLKQTITAEFSAENAHLAERWGVDIS